MTVCIASVARSGRVIVFASDQMADVATTTADFTMSKVDFLTPFWAVLWSGDDITSIPPIVRRAKRTLKPVSRDATVEQVSEATAKAFQAEEQKRAVAEHLSIYGMDMQQFLSNGQNVFGDTGFEVMHERLRQFDLGNVELLVCGFNELGYATLFTVGKGGVVRYYDKLGFWAIGSGQHAAIGSLVFREQRSIAALDQTIYNVCEAKFASEKASGVGKTTTLGLLTADGGPRTMELPSVQEIRSEWQKLGKPPVSEPTMTLIRKWLGVEPPSPARPQSAARSKRGRKRQPPSPE